jgi:hypothetical protein
LQPSLIATPRAPLRLTTTLIRLRLCYVEQDAEASRKAWGSRPSSAARRSGGASSADLGGSSDYTSDDPCRPKWRKVSCEPRWDTSESLLSGSPTGAQARLYPRRRPPAQRKGIRLKFRNWNVGATRRREATGSRRGELSEESSFLFNASRSERKSFTERGFEPPRQRPLRFAGLERARHDP